MLGNNFPGSSVLFEKFFRHCRYIQIFKLILWQSNTDYGFNILSHVNVKTNFNQSKTFVVILINTFNVSSLVIVKDNDIEA